MDTITEPRTESLVKVEVHHGDYRESFYGSGASILEAAEDAARQSSYSMGLFDLTDHLYESRAPYRDELQAKLEAGETYRGFGWCDFTQMSMGG